jgi:hypothetical protein
MAKAKISSPLALGTFLVLLLFGWQNDAYADAIPYPNVGTPNPAIYTFTATSTGDIVAYFAAGSTAAYDNQLGLLVNGVEHWHLWIGQSYYSCGDVT